MIRRGFLSSDLAREAGQALQILGLGLLRSVARMREDLDGMEL